MDSSIDQATSDSNARLSSIGIVGLGYVGLPLGVAFAEAGLDVVGVDVDAAKVEALTHGRTHARTSRTCPTSVCGRRSPA